MKPAKRAVNRLYYNVCYIYTALPLTCDKIKKQMDPGTRKSRPWFAHATRLPQMMMMLTCSKIDAALRLMFEIVFLLEPLWHSNTYFLTMTKGSFCILSHITV